MGKQIVCGGRWSVLQFLSHEYLIIFINFRLSSIMIRWSPRITINLLKHNELLTPFYLQPFCLLLGFYYIYIYIYIYIYMCVCVCVWESVMINGLRMHPVQSKQGYMSEDTFLEIQISVDIYISRVVIDIIITTVHRMFRDDNKLGIYPISIPTGLCRFTKHWFSRSSPIDNYNTNYSHDR